MKYKIALLMTCHNRRQTTLNCLNQIIRQSVNVDIFLVDDGSTDGTGDMIKNNFPKVHLIHGNGSLYWNRGMCLAWEIAKAHEDYDFYIWLNDDTILYDDALCKLVTCSEALEHKQVICAAIQDPVTGKFTYGGRDTANRPILPNGKLQTVHYMNGNLVLVPKFVEDRLGMLDSIFHHHLGDYDYGLRAKMNGMNVYSTPNYLGSCARNEASLTKGRKPNTTIIKRFKFLYSPLGVDPVAQFKYQYRHDGLLNAIKNFTIININNLMTNRMHAFYIKYFKKDSSYNSIN